MSVSIHTSGPKATYRRPRADSSPGRSASPIGLYELATESVVPADVRYVAVVALATVRTDWSDGGVALERIDLPGLRAARDLLHEVMRRIDLDAALGHLAEQETRLASALLDATIAERERSVV